MRVSTRIVGAAAAIGIGVIGITGCTPDEIAAWKAIKAQEAASASASPSPAPRQTKTLGERAVAAGETMLGAPYVWGGQSPRGFDCSGFVKWSYGQVGYYLPGGSYNQITYGTPVTKSELQLGDLVFYGPGGAQHVAMYYGNGKVIEAGNQSTGVHIAGINYTGTPTGYRRIS